MRRALVLGSGATRGGAWETGTLLGLRDAGEDWTRADLLLGTSAGSLLAALLALGVDLAVLGRHNAGAPAPDDPVIPLDYAAVAAAVAVPPPHPHRPSSPALALRALVHPTATTLLPALAGLLPTGPADPRLVGDAVRAVLPAPGAWPERLRVVVLDGRTGQRRVLGPADGVPLDTAVAASCAVPGLFRPVEAAGSRWYDGGFSSADSADLAAVAPAGEPVDEVLVLSPVTAVGEGWPPGLPSWVERQARLSLGRRLRREVALLRRAGARVRVLRPEGEVLALLGHDLMAPGPLDEVVEAARAAGRSAAGGVALAA